MKAARRDFKLQQKTKTKHNTQPVKAARRDFKLQHREKTKSTHNQWKQLAVILSYNTEKNKINTQPVKAARRDFKLQQENKNNTQPVKAARRTRHAMLIPRTDSLNSDRRHPQLKSRTSCYRSSTSACRMVTSTTREAAQLERAR